MTSSRSQRRSQCPGAGARRLRPAPLPNHLFTRDTSAWIYDGVSINAMAMPRAGERRSTTTRSTATTRCSFPARRLVGRLGGPPPRGRRRTRHRQRLRADRHGGTDPPAGVERLARRLFKAGSATSVIAVDMPARRSAMHLDTVMTMVDRDAFTIYPQVRTRWPPTLLPAGRSREREDDLFDAIARALDVPALRLFETGGDAYEPSASSGTTATTSWPSRPASCSPTSATSTPTRGCAAPVSR